MKKIIINTLLFDFENKILALFDGSLPYQFTKYNNFQFLADQKSYLILYPSAWKLDNPYYQLNSVSGTSE